MARMKFLCDAERCIECNACVTACKNEHEVPWGINRRRMRTANPIERAIQQEIKRRTSKVRVFPNEASLLRLVTAILVEIDEDWATTDRVYINMLDQND